MMPMSERAAHTPGPWAVVRGILKNGHIAIVAGDYGVAKVWDEEPGKDNENTANASLIAAAPEMLEALKAANQFIRNGIELGFIRMPDPTTPDSAHLTPPLIRAAIAKAEGRP